MTTEQEVFIREHFDETSLEELRGLFNANFNTNYTSRTIRWYTSKLGLKHSHVYSKEELAFIEEHSPNMTSESFAELFNKTFNTSISAGALKQKRVKMKIFIPNSGSYKKGEKPWSRVHGGYEVWYNKVMSVDPSSHLDGHRVTQKPHEIGHVRYAVGGKYKQIKTEEGWEYLHRAVWKDNFGDISEDENIIFADGNPDNVAPSNLRKVSNHIKSMIVPSNFHKSKCPELLDTAILYCELKTLLEEKGA